MKTISNLLKSVALCVVLFVMSVTTSAQSSCYLIGGISDNIEPTIENAEALKKFELPIGESKVFNIPAGKFDFYLCGDLSNPSATAFGAYENDEELLINDYGEAFASGNAGSTTHWTVKDWEGGNVIMYYGGGANLQIRSLPHSGSLNIIGSFNNWNMSSPSDYVLTETSPGSLIYSGKYVISETISFGFYFLSSLRWGSDVSNIGFKTEDLPLYYNRNGIAESAILFNYGSSASIMGYGSEVEFVVDLNSMTAKVIGRDRYAQSSLFVAGVIEEEPTIENEDHYKKWRLYETALGEYSGTINIPAGKFNICLFPELTADGWAAEALCAGASDVELEPNSMGMASCDMATMTGEAGHWIISDWQGGEVVINANMNNNTIKFDIPSLSRVFYLVGTMTGWASPDKANFAIYEQWALPETYEGSNVYENVFDMPEESKFRFYKHLTGWDGGDSYGVRVDDYPTEVYLTNGTFYGSIVKGKGFWSLSGFQGGKMRITIDMNVQSVSFEEIIAGIEELEASKIECLSATDGIWIMNAEGKKTEVYDISGRRILQLTISEESDFISLSRGIYVVKVEQSVFKVKI